MISPDQKKMFDVLEQQKKHQHQVDRVLKVVLPITAFLLAMICANINIPSTIGTLIIMTLAFWMVGIKRQVLWYWATGLAVYCLLDNLYSFQGQFNMNAFGRQYGTMITFLWIIGIGRPYIDRWVMNSDPNTPKNH